MRLRARFAYWCLRRMHAVAVLAFPRDFRLKFSRGMKDAFAEHCLQESRGGALRMLWHGMHANAESVSQGIGERVSRITGRHNAARRSGLTQINGGRRELVTWIVRDVRFAFRSFARTPVFSVTVLAIMTLGIGATTEVFTLVDSLLLRGLPFENSN